MCLFDFYLLELLDEDDDELELKFSNCWTFDHQDLSV